MAQYINMWFKHVQSYNVKLIAGEHGLARPFHNSHIIERPEFTEFLEGGEIVFITGVAIYVDEELIEIVRNCFECHGAAVVLNTGYYIDHIPESVTEFCNANNFPLFTVPWSVKLESLIHETYTMLIENRDENSHLEILFENAINHPDMHDKYLVGLKNAGFEPEWKYCVGIIEPDSVDGNDICPRILLTIRRKLSDGIYRIFAYQKKQQIVVVFGNYTTEAAGEMLKEMIENIQTSLSLKGRLFYSIGRNTKSARCIQKSFVLAQKILNLNHSGQIPGNINNYNSLGIYKIILALENQDILNQIHHEYLEPLISYDKACGTEYVEFLINYLKYDGRIKDLSEKLFIHRNTALYKAKKIEEILDCDLHNLETKLYLLIAASRYFYQRL